MAERTSEEIQKRSYVVNGGHIAIPAEDFELLLSSHDVVAGAQAALSAAGRELDGAIARTRELEAEVSRLSGRGTQVPNRRYIPFDGRGSEADRAQQQRQERIALSGLDTGTAVSGVTGGVPETREQRAIRVQAERERGERR